MDQALAALPILSLRGKTMGAASGSWHDNVQAAQSGHGFDSSAWISKHDMVRSTDQWCSHVSQEIIVRFTDEPRKIRCLDGSSRSA
jgi:hypothetical protein